MTWWWLSFVDKTMPRGQRHRGVFIAEGKTFIEAVEAALDLGCDMGGEVLGTLISEPPAPGVCNRALTRAEIELYGERNCQMH